MLRNILGSIIALAGATAAVLSPFRAWYDGRHGSDFRVENLFSGLTPAHSVLLGSVFLPLAFAALLTLAAILFRSRAVMTVSGLLVLATAVLWLIQRSRLPAGLNTNSVGPGLAYVLIGAALLLLAAVVMRGRRPHRVPDATHGHDHPLPGSYDPYGDTQTMWRPPQE
jgi:hypothetical protein